MSDEVLAQIVANAHQVVLWAGDGVHDSRPIFYGGVVLMPCSLSGASMLIGMRDLNVVDFVISDDEKDAFQVADKYAFIKKPAVAKA